jgi:hypothetical protein
MQDSIMWSLVQEQKSAKAQQEEGHHPAPYIRESQGMAQLIC